MEAVVPSSSSLLDRARRMLLSPRQAWADIAAAGPRAGDVFRSWLLPLLALGAVATFIGQWVFGSGFGGFRIRPGLLGSLQIAITGLVFSLLASAVIAAIANALSALFGGARKYDRAFALVAFGSAGALVGNLAAIVPALWILAIAGGIYSVYLLWLGIEPMMAVPARRRLPYLLSVMICGGITSVALALLLQVASDGMAPGLGGGGTISVETPGGVMSRSRGELEELNRRLEEATQRMDQARRSGDGKGVAEGAGDAVKAIASIGPAADRKPMPAQALKEWLPPRLAGLERTDFEVNDGQALGIGGSMARASYGSGARTMTVEVLDAGGVAGIVAVIAGLAQGERESATETERSYSMGKRKIIEKHRKDGSYGEYTTILANGVMVRTEGRGVGGAALGAAVQSLDLGLLERP